MSIRDSIGLVVRERKWEQDLIKALEEIMGIDSAVQLKAKYMECIVRGGFRAVGCE